MTVRSTKKTYNKIIRLAVGEAVSVDFNDTEVTKMDCNFFSV